MKPINEFCKSLHNDIVFESDNEFGIPSMRKVELSEIDSSWPFLEFRSKERKGVCHFYLYDFKFETTWNNPEHSMEIVREYKATATPNFSIYTDWPRALNLWNTYRSRWCGRYWQEYGIRVIPTIGWAGEESFDYAFAGVPKGSVVTIAYAKSRKKEWEDGFYRGYEQLIKRVDPQAIFVYAVKFPSALMDDRVIMVDTFWKKKNALLKKLKQQEE